MKADRENLQASVLDRLVDLEPGVSRESVQHRLFNKNQIKAAVVRDLENLLNTRRRITEIPESYEQLEESLFSYGLGDYSTENPKSPVARRKLLQEIRKTIMRFEPRLKNVTIRMDSARQDERAFGFRITGMLVVEPLSEPVVFDTYFDVNRSEYVITG